MIVHPGRLGAGFSRRARGRAGATAACVIGVACLLFVPIAVQAQRANGQTTDGLAIARKAAKALSKGQLPAAVMLYTEALNDKRLSNDRRSIILTDRGVVYARLNQPKRAIADFNSAVTLFPEYAAAYNNRGAFLVSLGAIEEGIKDFDRALVLAPGYVAAWNNRAAAHAKADRYYAAIADYGRAVKLAPSLAEPLTGRARIYMKQARPHAALRDLSRALGNDNRFALGYRVRAEARMELQEYEAAAEDLSRAIAFNPTDAQAYLLRGRAYMKEKRFDAALKDFTRLVEINPRSAEGFRARGNVNILLDDFDQAERDLARAIEIEPRNPLTFAYRALMYKKRDQPELGAQEIRKALAIDSENAVVLWAKGELEEARTMMAEAAESYRKALAVDPQLEMAQLGLRRLGLDVPDATTRLPGKGVAGWHIELRGTRYEAINPQYPDLRVPIEMAGKGQPKLLGWEERKAPFKGIGLLRFSVGEAPSGSTSAEMEIIAILDTRNETLVSLEPHKHGKAVARWTWQDGAVNVAAIDGLTSTHQLRQIAKPVAAATTPSRRSRRARRRYDSNGTPRWAPWADNTSRPRARSSPRRRGRARRRPKTLFDLILGN